MKEEIVTTIKTEMVQAKNLLCYIRNMIVSKEAQKLKPEDAKFATFLQTYVKELENSKVCPQWVHDLMKRRYNIKLNV